MAGREELDEPTRAFEAIALGLRRVQGLSRRAFAAEFGEDPVQRFAAQVADGRARDLLAIEGDRLRLTRARPAVCLGRQPPLPAARRGGSPRRAAGLMLFPPATLQAIADGKVTLAFRRWERPRVKAGGRQRTAIGVIAFDAVEAVDRDDLDEADATAAGFASVNAAAGLRRPADGRHDLPHPAPARRAGPASRAARVAPGRGAASRAHRPPGSPRSSEPPRSVDATGAAPDPRPARRPCRRPGGRLRPRASAVQARRSQAQGARPDREPESGLPPLPARPLAAGGIRVRAGASASGAAR